MKFFSALSIVAATFIFGASGMAQTIPTRPTPPPVPPVPPIVSKPAGIDTNNNRLDDAIDDKLTSARAVLKTHGISTQSVSAATSVIDEPVAVSFVFSQQITQPQIDAFLAAGGTFDKIFQSVSFGWTGKISRSKAADVATSMGETLLIIQEARPMELHLDEATQTGRVRPVVWDAGLDGAATGADKITVAILDTGVDGTHTDLAGRMEYWKDWTSDNHPTAQDVGHHGSHVAGIAFGTGAAISASATTLHYTDHGVIPQTGFFPSPIHVPLPIGATINWTSNMHWETGAGVTNANLVHIIRSSNGLYGTFDGTNGVSSPINLNSGFFNGGFASPYNDSNTYTGAVKLGLGTGGSAHFANAHTITYATPGDGYSPLRGVAPGTSWAGLKVFTDAGSGNSLDIGEAIDDIVFQRQTHNIKVANMSIGVIGSPGIDSVLRNRINTAASNGIVMVISAGNSGDDGAGGAGEASDPGRANYAITVAASSDVNQLTAYSSHGFAAPGDGNTGDEDMKPDICAPGGSTAHQSNILSIDSNTGDQGTLADVVPNDYMNIQGTSMASPFMAGCAALVIDAMQDAGETWDFTGPAALADVLRVKMILLMTATETNLLRESSASGNPVLDRGGKDINEGYGMVNADAAVEGLLNPPLNSNVAATETFEATNVGRRCWARRVNLSIGDTVNLVLAMPSTGDYDIYLYQELPDQYGNPQILASSVSAGNNTDESLSYNPTATETAWLVVKRVSGDGAWSISGSLPVAVSAFTLE